MSGGTLSASCWRRRWISRMERLRGSSASRMAVADGAAPGVLGGHEQVVRPRARKPRGCARVTPAFCDTAPISATGASTGPALHDGALEIARHGVAQAAQDLGGRVALLLRVDHVALGEHRAAAGDARGAAGRADDARPPLPPSTACAAPAGRETSRCRRRIRRSGRNRRCCAPSSRMYFELSPPISKTVRTCG